MPRIILFVICAFIAAGYGFVLATTQQAVWWVKHFGYWLMLANLLLLLVTLLRILMAERNLPSPEASSREHRLGRFLPVSFILAVTATLWALQPGGFKITMDEPVMASASLRMHVHQEVMVTARTHLIQDSFTQLDGYVDKRPYFYPFLVSLVHDLTGYRSENGKWLNLAITPLLLGLLFYLGRIYGPPLGGYLAVSLVATLPLVAMNVNGVGFELLNLVMLMATLLAGVFYLKQPSERRLDLLILLGILLAQTRYESALYILAVGVVILIGWARERRIILSLLSCLAPLLCLPIALRQKIIREHEGFWQLSEETTTAFGIGFIPDNLIHALRFFFGWSDRPQANSLLLSVVFVLAVIGFAYLAARRHPSRQPAADPDFKIGAMVFGGVAVFNFSLLMAYHWGQLDDIMATRIVLPFILLQILVVAAFIRRLGAVRKHSLLCLAGIWLFFLCLTLPTSLKTNFMHGVPGWHECMWLQQEVQKRAGQRVLFVSNRHLIPIVERAAAIPEFYAKERKSELRLHHELNTYDEILFAHKLTRASEEEAFVPVTPLYKDFELEHLSERLLGRNTLLRISRLTGVKWLEGEEDLNLLERLPPEDDPEARAVFLATHLP